LVNNYPEAGMMKNLFTSGEAASQVGEPRWRLLYLIEKGVLPGPSLQVPGRRLFTTEDIEKIARALGKRREPIHRGQP
jgi:hypothetical protein